MKRISVICVVLVLLVSVMVISAYAWVNRVEVKSSVSSARIDLGGTDDVIISNIRLRASEKTLYVSFNWSKKTVNNPGEIDQIFVAFDRKVVDVVFNGIPGPGGNSGSYSGSIQCDFPTPNREVTVYVAMTPSRNVAEGRAHYEVEGGGARASIGTIIGYE